MTRFKPQADFFDALLEDIMFGAMVPKVQIERAIGPILGFFLPDVFHARNGKQLVMLCPEFPLRKPTNNQSTNIDWLMYDKVSNELVFVELKTTESSMNQEQLDVYIELVDKIARGGAEFLYDDLKTIGKASSEKGKYAFVQSLISRKLEAQDIHLKAQPLFAQCNKASIIYIAPIAAKRPVTPVADSAIDWITFGELPEAIESRHADRWPAVRASLVAIDKLDRKARDAVFHSWNSAEALS